MGVYTSGNNNDIDSDSGLQREQSHTPKASYCCPRARPEVAGDRGLTRQTPDTQSRRWAVWRRWPWTHGSWWCGPWAAWWLHAVCSGSSPHPPPPPSPSLTAWDLGGGGTNGTERFRSWHGNGSWQHFSQTVVLLLNSFHLVMFMTGKANIKSLALNVIKRQPENIAVKWTIWRN